MDQPSLDLLAQVLPVLAFKIGALDAAFEAEYPDDSLCVVQGLRSYEDQAKEYAQGRTAPGRIVTSAPPGHSMHEFGLAVDLCPASLKAKPNWDPTNPKWEWLAQKGVELGLTVGAHFVHAPPDKPHFQLTGRFPPSPNEEMREVLKNVGIVAVWVESGLYNVPEVTPA